MPELRTPTGPQVAEEHRVAEARERFLHRQRARRWLVVRRILAVLVTLSLVGAGVWAVFFSSWLAVHGAEVHGTSLLSARQVERVARVPVGVPLATADLGAIEARVEDLAPVRSATVSRAWPDRVRIDVTERVAVAAVEWSGSWRGMDGSGVLFRSYPRKPAGLPSVTMRASTSVDALAEAAAVVQALPRTLLTRVQYVEVGSIDAISLHLRNGSLVHWGSADESDQKVKVLQVLLPHRASVYDVTAPGRPTLKR
jgi:cell division protein FtsQ